MAAAGDVTLISAEGEAFTVPRAHAEQSSVIRTMLSSSFQERSGEVRFPEISSKLLKIVVDFFAYKAQLAESEASGLSVALDEFPIREDQAIELLHVANFLDV